MEFILAYIIESKERYNTSVNAVESNPGLNDDVIVTSALNNSIQFNLELRIELNCA